MFSRFFGGFGKKDSLTGFHKEGSPSSLSPGEAALLEAAKKQAQQAASTRQTPPPNQELVQAKAKAPWEAALSEAIRQQAQTHPFTGAKICGKEIFQRLTQAMKTDKGVHAESLFCCLGALGGYACQASLRAQAVANGLPPDNYFVVVQDRGGKRFFYGDQLNLVLLEDQHSLWSLVAGAAQLQAAVTLPDIREIAAHTAESLGSESFGIPRYPDKPANDLPINYLRAWSSFLPLLEKYAGGPQYWPAAFALAAEEAFSRMKKNSALEKALKIIMEAAIPMSKVELNNKN